MRELLVALVVLLRTVATADANLVEFLGLAAALVASVAFGKSIGRRCCRLQRGLARLIPLGGVFAVVSRAAVGPGALRFSLVGQHVSWCCSTQGFADQPPIAVQLERIPGRHLVIVRYMPGHRFTEAWVHNPADIGGARVVWAQELGPAGNRRLLAYFKGRTVWLLEADQKPPRLSPYPADAGPRPATNQPESR